MVSFLPHKQSKERWGWWRMIYRSWAPLTSIWSCKMCGKYCRSVINRVRAIANLESETITRSTDRFNAPRINCGWCPHFIYSIITRLYNCERKYWNIYFPPCVSFLLWATEISRTVKQPISAELNIEPHCETTNQSRAHYYSWPFQISQ